MFVSRNSPDEASATYLMRRDAITHQAAGIDRSPTTIDYLPEEHATWRDINELLRPLWDSHAAKPLHLARLALDLPVDSIPQLHDVTHCLKPLTNYEFVAVPGTVPGETFFGALGNRTFPSTQFIRESGNPAYTEAPDIVHEVIGHAVALANPLLADLHQLAGLASLAAPNQLTEIAAVFWYSVEFGVVRETNAWKAYGTGLLSSIGELGWFAEHSEIRPLDIGEMIATPYDISDYQPIIFGAESLAQLHEVVGGYYQSLITQTEEVSCVTS